VDKLSEAAMSLNYSILEQTTDQLREIENSPSVSMWPYLVDSAQTALVNKISIYTEAGKTSEQARRLYMNATALEVWTSMKRATARTGEVHRPPKSAQLCFGMPFSE
jgi:hypothetical protein